MSDFEIVEAALKAYARWAYEFRDSGLYQDYELAKNARAALERIKQPSLFGTDTASSVKVGDASRES